MEELVDSTSLQLYHLQRLQCGIYTVIGRYLEALKLDELSKILDQPFIHNYRQEDQTQLTPHRSKDHKQS